MANVDKHVILVEIDWDTGTEGYAYESYRTPSLHYQDLVQSIGQVDRSVALFGGINFPTASITLYNRDLYFSQKLYAAEHRNRALRLKVIPPNSGLSSALVVMEGRISKAKISNGLLQLEVIGHNFEEVFNATMDKLLPVLDKKLFPHLPPTQVPTILPLIYGGVWSATGDDLEAPTTDGALRGYLIETEGVADDTWTSRTAASTRNWQAVAWSPELGMFAAVANSGIGSRVMTSVATGSTNAGVTWVSRTSAADEAWSNITWAPELSLFVATSDNTSSGSGVMTSPDGITWALRTMGDNAVWSAAAWAPELALFAVVGWDGAVGLCRTSPNGTTWTNRTIDTGYSWQAVTWSPELGIFCAVATGSGSLDPSVATSPDGVTWTLRPLPATAGGFSNFLYGICWSSTRAVFIAIAAFGTGDQFIISSNGIDWIRLASPAERSWYRVIWCTDHELFVALSANGSGTDIALSDDGVTWRLVPTTVGFQCNGLAAADGITGHIVAVGNSGAVMTSPEDLGGRYLYALAGRPIAGDGETFGLYPGVISEIYRFGVPKSPGYKTSDTTTYGTFQITVVGFGADQRSETADGTQDRPEITFFTSGAVDGTDVSTDAIFKNPVDVKEDFLSTYSAVTLDSTSLATASALAQDQHTADYATGAVANTAVGVVVQDGSMKVRDVVELMDRSFGMITFPTRDGKLGVIVSPIGADPAATVDLTDESDVLKDSFEIIYPDEVATAISAQYSYRWTAGQQGDPTPGLQYSRQLPDFEVFGAKDRLFPAQHYTISPGTIIKQIEMPYCRRTSAVVNVLRAYSEYLHPAAQFIQFAVPIEYFSQIEIGDYVTITHWQGISSAGGYSAVKMRVLGITTVLDAAGPQLILMGFKRAPGVVVHDNFDRGSNSNSLGSSWVELEAAATDMTVGTGVSEIASFNQTRCLKSTVATSAAAYWDDTSTNADQLASIECVYFDTAQDQTWGVFVRGSGVRSAFYGYCAKVIYDNAGTAVLALYKYNGANLGTSTGTLVTSVALTIPTMALNTWRAQGDILQISAVNDRIEVYYWSDIAANNLGKALTLFDTTLWGPLITSGNMGIITYGCSGLALTNFYGRSWVT